MYEYEQVTENRKKNHYGLFSVLLISIFAIGIILGGIYTYSTTSNAIDGLNTKLSMISEEYDETTDCSIQYYIDETSLSELYSSVKDSIVVITGIVDYQSYFYSSQTTVQGSGFVYQLDNEYYVITNYHVVSDASNLIVTFSNGNGYDAILIGSDAYADLAVLEVNAPSNEFIDIQIVSSSNLNVGDPVVAIGTPLGLDSTMTTGIVSQLDRTIDESLAGNFAIANIIQTNVAINPGNSGGPLLNYNGEVIGITTAIIEDSEGIGFAIPSDTILKEIESLITQGYYSDHSWLGISGVDMTYAIAEAIDAEVTYGWLISYVSENSAASNVGLLGGYQQMVIIDEYVFVGGDIIIAIDGNRIIDGDDLMSYLEAETVPGQMITLTIIRDGGQLNIPIELGQRPVVS